MTRKIIKTAWAVFKYFIYLIVCLEVISFLIVSATNYFMYGHFREGSRARYDPYALFVQAHGVRPTSFSYQGPDGENVRLIWFLGGSTMRGATDNDDLTIASQVAKRLNQSGGNLKFKVVNWGINSYNSLMEIKYLQKLLIEEDEKPDLIVFYDGANDVKYFTEFRDPYGHYGRRRVKALIEGYYQNWFGHFKQLNAAIQSSLTMELYNKFHQVILPVEENSPALAQDVDLTVKRYDHAARMAGCYGADFVLFWQPMRWVEECGPGPANEDTDLGSAERFMEVKKNFQIVSTALEKGLKNKPYYFDLTDCLCQRTSPVYSKDGVHLLDQGRIMVAEQIARVIEERFAASN